MPPLKCYPFFELSDAYISFCGHWQMTTNRIYAFSEYTFEEFGHKDWRVKTAVLLILGLSLKISKTSGLDFERPVMVNNDGYY